MAKPAIFGVGLQSQIGGCATLQSAIGSSNKCDPQRHGFTLTDNTTPRATS